MESYTYLERMQKTNCSLLGTVPLEARERDKVMYVQCPTPSTESSWHGRGEGCGIMSTLTPRTPESGVSQVQVHLQAKLGSSKSRRSPEREVSEQAVAKSIREAQLDSQVESNSNFS